MDDTHDVSKYTDQQLYDILDINNPTDRELEARIVHLINKYSNMQNESGYKLAIFFQNIYSRFFDLEDTIEGFNNPLEISDKYIDQSGNQQKDITKAINENEKYKTTTQDIQSTISFDYVKDKFGLNPLLKQTIKRIICIDSQYRDNKNTTLPTEFTFNLSEPLKDVVSLKLESIQIPLTWWTISKSYGSNFFYLKGNKEGINDGTHDYKFSIPVGYYTIESTNISNNKKNIYDAINESINDVSNVYSDVNFGNTSVVKDNGTTKFSIDIQKVYNESNYTVDFINNNTNSIPNYLGYINSKVYEPYSIYSNSKTELTTNIIDNNNKFNFQIDDSNNYFYIIQYNGPDEYKSDASINTFIIKIESGVYYRDELVETINNQLKNSYFLDSTSSIDIQNITDPSNVNSGYSYYKMKIKLNRYKVKQVSNSKVIVIFPDESNSITNTIWTKQINKSSALFFDSSYNETNTIYGEINSIESSIQVNQGTNIFLKCTNPIKYKSTNDFSLNDYIIPIKPGNYNLTDYIDVLNNSFINYSYNNIIKGTVSLIESKIKFNIDIVKKFDNNNWKIQFNEKSILNKWIKIPINTGNKLTDTSNTFLGTFKNKTSTVQNFIVDTSYILTFYPTSDNIGNKNDVSYNIYIPNFGQTKPYSNYLLLLNDIESTLKKYPIKNGQEIQYPLSKSFIKSNTRIDESNQEFIDVSLNLNIEYFLSENNYDIQFNDEIWRKDPSNNKSSWQSVKLDSSYNLIKKKLPQDPSGESQNYSTIIGNEQIILNKIKIDSTNNKLQIMMDTSCNIYIPKNNFIIKIPEKDYTKYDLIQYINSELNKDDRTYGSKFIVYVKNNNEYVKLLMNINIIYTTKDYKLVFYDPYSFIKCYVGAKSVKNTTWDSTLGWILGFRDYTEYELLESNQVTNNDNTYYIDSTQGTYKYNAIYNNDLSYGVTNSIIQLSGDTNCTLITYTYFYILLDDYIQNHINDGLVSMSKTETDINLPSYSAQSIKTCDPITNTNTISTTTNTDGLTSKQIYALNQALISKRNKIKSISNNSYINDIFAMIPLRTGGIPNGSYYVETGGNLQNQERLYFGPVNIQRMTIKLVSHNGDIIDLNNTDWSFSFICEQLYRV